MNSSQRQCFHTHFKRSLLCCAYARSRPCLLFMWQVQLTSDSKSKLITVNRWQVYCPDSCVLSACPKYILGSCSMFLVSTLHRKQTACPGWDWGRVSLLIWKIILRLATCGQSSFPVSLEATPTPCLESFPSRPARDKQGGIGSRFQGSSVCLFVLNVWIFSLKKRKVLEWIFLSDIKGALLLIRLHIYK